MLIEQEELTIYEVEALHKSIQALYENGNVMVDMSQVRKIDMSVIQLFISAQMTCVRNKKLFQLQNINEELSKILRLCACEFLLGDANG
ncbi:MAG: STAS domain-containing protein [Sulfurimonas sp.]|nr:STAS domain-containing protein [Sulfurimonas sp.]MDQ7061659.1 STAS domain-containing protein [Sulfurimonas sp.]